MDIFAGIEGVPKEVRYQWLTPRRPDIEYQILNPGHKDQNTIKVLRLDKSDDRPVVGFLDLPVEIIRIILMELDLQSLCSLRVTNSSALSIVQALPEYLTITTHAPNLVDGLYATKLVSFFTLDRIYNLATSSRCTICNHFGGFVFLPGLQRCCQRCAEYDIAFVPVSPDTARKLYGVKGKINMDLLPKLCAVPGSYGSKTGYHVRYKGKRKLISRAEARKTGSTEPKSLRWDNMNVGHVYQRNMCLMPMPVLNAKKRSVDVGLQCLGCWQAFRKHGSCLGCQSSLPNGVDKDVKDVSNMEHLSGTATRTCRAVVAKDRLYSEEGILEHLDVCEDTQMLVEENIDIMKVAIERSEFKEVFTKVQEAHGDDSGQSTTGWLSGARGISVMQTGRFLRSCRN